jgi:hypothetical protein
LKKKREREHSQYIEEFLWNQLQHKDDLPLAFIDLYVEFGKTLRDGYLSRLVSIAKKFSNCIPVMKTGGDTLIIDKDNYKKDMICRMFRAHVVDIRKDLLKKDDPKTLFHFHKIILGVTNGLKPYDPTKTTNEDFIKNINVMKDRYRKEFVLFSTKLDFKLDSKVAIRFPEIFSTVRS